MMDAKHIAEFAEAVDPPTSVRNLRYLISEGILPEPDYLHRAAYLGSRHAAAYALYSDLAARGFSAKLIATLQSMTESDLEATLTSIHSLRKINATKETV